MNLFHRSPDQEKSTKKPLSVLRDLAVQETKARAIFSYLAIEETGYSAADVARFLGVKRMSVHEAVTRGKTLYAEHALLGQEGD